MVHITASDVIVVIIIITFTGCRSSYEVVINPWYAATQKVCSCTDFAICTVLNWLIDMQLRTHIIENHATAYPTMKLHTQPRTFRQQKNYKEWRHDNCISWHCDNLVSAPTPWFIMPQYLTHGSSKAPNSRSLAWIVIPLIEMWFEFTFKFLHNKGENYYQELSLMPHHEHVP